jgi:hypothetical protein
MEMSVHWQLLFVGTKQGVRAINKWVNVLNLLLLERTLLYGSIVRLVL